MVLSLSPFSDKGTSKLPVNSCAYARLIRIINELSNLSKLSTSLIPKLFKKLLEDKTFSTSSLFLTPSSTNSSMHL